MQINLQISVVYIVAYTCRPYFLPNEMSSLSCYMHDAFIVCIKSENQLQT